MNVQVHVNFPKAAAYRAMFLGAARAARDGRAQDQQTCPSERHLRCIWADPKLRPSALATTQGETVHVVSPGTWNMEAGPDFMNAELRIDPGSRRLIGDVEIHQRPADWKQHSHSSDPAYKRVIAHVTWLHGALPAGFLPPGAVEIPLRAAVQSNPRFAFESIDITAYPFAAQDSPRPCAVALSGWTPTERAALLESAGHERLRQKSVAISNSLAELGDPAQVFHEEICCALGYKHNRAPFRRLASELPVSLLRRLCGSDAFAAFSLLAGYSGLLPVRTRAEGDGAAVFMRRMWDCWWRQESALGGKVMSRSEWRLSGSRPHNHPLRRMAVAAAFAVAPVPLPDAILSLDASDPDEWFCSVTALFARADASFPFWQRHLTIGAETGAPIALVGAERIAAITTNILIPFLAASGRDTTALVAALPHEADNILMRRTAHALFGHDHNPALYRNGLAQQGLLQIAHDFCLNARKDCADCPLTNAIRETRQPIAP